MLGIGCKVSPQKDFSVRTRIEPRAPQHNVVLSEGQSKPNMLVSADDFRNVVRIGYPEPVADGSGSYSGCRDANAKVARRSTALPGRARRHNPIGYVRSLV